MHLSRASRSGPVVLSILSSILVFCIAARADAIAPNQESFDFHATGTFGDCGYPIAFDDSGHIRLLFQPIPGSGGQRAKVHQQVTETVVFTNVASGAFVTVELHLLDTETRAKRLPDGNWQINRVKAGQSFTIRTADGKVVSRDRGMERQINIFDDNGIVSGELVAVHGPHPSFGRDYCDLLTPLIGPSA